jgi:hypothetical protein
MILLHVWWGGVRSLEGFRTPAPMRVARSVSGRHPKTSTVADLLVASTCKEMPDTQSMTT